jgi:glycosyltransferase involved in cell wall biosynthesis
MSYLAKKEGVTPVYIPQMSRELNPLKDLISLVAIYKILRKERPDIIHTHTAKAGALGRIAAILAGVPIKIHTFHGHVFDGYFGALRRRLFTCTERALALFTDRIITVSDRIRAEIVDKFHITGKDKCVVVKLGLDLGRFTDELPLKGYFRKKIGVGDDVTLIGIVGRLVPVKNHLMFLEAVKLVIRKASDMKLKFVLVGDGEMKERLINRCKELGIEGSVIFTGWESDLGPVYADLDMVALSSINEGTPVSIIEAMASAKPVVSTDVGGVRDILQDGKTGYLSLPNDAEDMSHKILELLKDKEKRLIFGAAARESVRNEYSRERLVRDIGHLYKECLNTVRK